MKEKQKTLKQLFIPIYIETLFLTLVGGIDTIMLSYVGDRAVGGVGTANSYLGIFLIAFSVISSGLIAVMTQYIGSGKPIAAKQAKNIGLIFNAVIGTILSVVMLFFGGTILNALNIAPALYSYAETYMQIVGGSCILSALIPVFNCYLRAFGYTKEPLIGTILSNIVNIGFNALFLYACNLGVMGIAISTVIARVVNLVYVIIMARKIVRIANDENHVSVRLLLKQILWIGFPAALETMLYNFAMAMVVVFLNQMDADGYNMTARSYAMQLTNFSYIAGAALAQANAILTGWQIGRKEYDQCYKATNRSVKFGILTAMMIAVPLAFCGKWIIGFFTHDADMIDMIGNLLIIDIALEIGRASNMIYGSALKTCGDAVFTVSIGVVFMYIFAVFGTYFLGLQLNWLVVGAWIAMAADECARAVLMYARWNSRKWENKVLVK